MKFTPLLYVLLLAAPNLVNAQSEFICPGLKSKTTLPIGLDEYIDYKTQDGAPDIDYTNGVNCNVQFKRKKGADCELKFNCTHFDLKSKKPAPKCQDKMIISGKKYCQSIGPDVTVSGSKLKVAFKTNKKGTATGAVCTAYCVPPPPPPGLTSTTSTSTTTTMTTTSTSTTTSTTTTSTSTSRTAGLLMAIGGRSISQGPPIRSAEVLTTSCEFPLPDDRRLHVGFTTTDGKTLVCGGKNNNNERQASCFQFDYGSKTWNNHSPLLYQRNAASVVVLTNGVYVLGGESIGGYTTQRSSDFLATGSSIWTPGPVIPQSVYVSCAATVSDTEFVVIGGGYDDETQALVYNVQTQVWREWPRLADRWRLHSCVNIGDKILMAGNLYGYKTLLVDTATGSVQELPPLNNPRYGASMVLYGDNVMILGGSWKGVVRTDGEIWNRNTETWEVTDISLQTARYYFALVNLAQDVTC